MVFSQFRNANFTRYTFRMEVGVNAKALGVNAVEISGLTPWKKGR
jgi:hypothetical protein